jgi:hydrogenase nickel incorporation protein HypB
MMAVRTIEVRERVMARNDELAYEVRRRLTEARVPAFNLVSSPGSGKTLLLERTLERLGAELDIAVITGDVQTRNDAERLARWTDRLVQAVVTGGACHLDASQILNALDAIDLESTELLFIENVGNLVCPAVYDLGEALNVVALAVTEGEDKPLKYPVMFRKADLVLITKIDLLPHLDVRLETIADALARVMPQPAYLPVSARTGAGIDRWVAWLHQIRALTEPSDVRQQAV